MCLKEKTLSKGYKIFCNHPMRSEQSEHTAAEGNKQLNTTEQGLFWNHVYWNFQNDPLLMIWTFPCLFYGRKLAVQTARLQYSSVMKRLQTAVSCKLHGAYFESSLLYLRRLRILIASLHHHHIIYDIDVYWCL